MRLWIAEKPSAGRAIAAHLPGPRSQKGTHIECGSGDVVTWCRGHLLEDLAPPDYNPAWKAWEIGQLPMLPEQFKLRVAKDGSDQFEAIRAFHRKASTIVHAGDVDREGQLIVDEVLEFLGNRKPVMRLDTSALDDVNLSRAVKNLTDNSHKANITVAGHFRRNGDWLFGMNGTRILTLAAQKAGYKGSVLNFGRVKTPTMRLVVERDLKIENFKSVPYFEVVATNKADAGMFDAKWRPKPEASFLDSEKRVLDKAIADRLAANTRGKTGRVTAYSNAERSQRAPLLFSLSALQTEASRRYGLSVSKTLEAAQALYEAKLTSYPRTDCRYVPVAQLADAGAILRNVAHVHSAVAGFVAKANPSQRTDVWNDDKVTAHHAIVPTQQRVDLNTLDDNQRKVYDLIARSYLAQFLPAHRYRQVAIEVEYASERFATGARSPLEAGWKELYGSEAAEPGDDKDGDETRYARLPVLKIGDAVYCTDAMVVVLATKPPKRFTEGTLIHAMANIHEEVTDPEIRKRLRENAGIGTEATRAPTIEALKRGEKKRVGNDQVVFDPFLVTEGKNIISTPKARSLILFVKEVYPQAADYGITALFEQRLDQIAEGKAEPAAFMTLLLRLVEAMKAAAFSKPLVMPAGMAAAGGSRAFGPSAPSGAAPRSRGRSKASGSGKKVGARKKRGTA